MRASDGGIEGVTVLIKVENYRRMHPAPGATCSDGKDVAGTLARVRALGATVMKEVTEVPGMGWFGILVDPGGAAFALWQPRM